MPPMRSLPERFFGACLAIFVGAWLLHWAVDLITSVWVPLILIGGGVTAVLGLVALRRSRSGW